MDIEDLIEGERVALGPMRRDLADTCVAWMNRVDVKSGLGNLALYNRETEEAWLDDVAKENGKVAPASASFTIYDRRDGEPVGTCSLMNIDYRHARSGFGIALGERRGEGLGTEATRLTLDWAFNVLSLENVRLEVMPWNAGAIRAYEKAGFRLIGRRRGALVVHGRRWDEIYMDAVPGEFTGSVLAGHLPSDTPPTA
jgi:diamine N-acetyltransferase